jgi:hypothetical protein
MLLRMISTVVRTRYSLVAAGVKPLLPTCDHLDVALTVPTARAQIVLQAARGAGDGLLEHGAELAGSLRRAEESICYVDCLSSATSLATVSGSSPRSDREAVEGSLLWREESSSPTTSGSTTVPPSVRRLSAWLSWSGCSIRSFAWQFRVDVGADPDRGLDWGFGRTVWPRAAPAHGRELQGWYHVRSMPRYGLLYFCSRFSGS